MLSVYIGDDMDFVWSPSVYFKNTFEPEWLTTDLAKEMILDVDKSEVVSAYCINSPVLGQIPPERLSGGVQTLLLMLNDDSRVFNATACGDNCAKWILKIAEMKDLTVRLGHCMDFGDGEFEICVLNDGATIYNMEELVLAVHKYL